MQNDRTQKYTISFINDGSHAMIKFSVSVLVSVLALAASHAYAAQCEPGKVAEKYPVYAGKTVKIAASPTQPPFAFTNPNEPEKMSGFEAELIERAMTCGGLKFQFVKGAWSALLPSLFSGATDVMIGSVNYRPDRAERGDFVLFMQAGQTVVVPRGNVKKIGSMDELCGLIGSSVVGGTPAQAVEVQSRQCVQRGKPAIDFRPAVASDASYRQVLNGRVDFVMDDTGAAVARVANEPELAIAFSNTTDIRSGMVVAKGNAEMLQIVADGLAVQQQDGTMAALAAKYGLPPETVVPVEVRR